MVGGRKRDQPEQGLDLSAQASLSLYQRTNTGAHKEPLTDVSAPALTWHRSFLIPRRYTGFEEEYSRIVSGIPRSVRCEGTPQELDRATPPQRRLTTDDIKPLADNIIKHFLDALTTSDTPFKTFPYAHKTIIMFDRLLDDNDPALPELAKEPGPLAGVLRRGERTFVIDTQWRCFKVDWGLNIRIRLLTNIFTVTVTASPKSANIVELVAQDDFHRWTEEFWWRFYAFSCRRWRLDKMFESPLFASEFADIRGLILPCDALPFGTGALPPSRRFPDWGPAAAGKLKSYIVTNEAYECSASYFLNRRALHLTALGPQPLGLSRNRRRPSTYLTCVHTRDASGKEVVGKRQLGRLVDRMNLLGTMRLAAVLDLDLLDQASLSLSQIDDLKKTARSTLQRFELGLIKPKDTRNDLESFRDAVNNIANEFLDKSPAGVGITFRIESSRYYVSQFNANIKSLRLTRVEGFQRYDQFVQRRLGVTFEAIDRLGLRYDRALKEMEGIDQSFSSIQSRFTGEKLTDIQRTGEALLLCFLVPYYIIATLGHLIEVSDQGWQRTEEILSEPLKRTIYAAIWLGWLIIGVYRYVFPDDDKPSQTRDISVLFTLVFTPTVFAAWLFFARYFAARPG